MYYTANRLTFATQRWRCTELAIITSQRGSAWHRYIGRLLSKGKMLLTTPRPGKTNEHFGTKLGRRDYVGKIYKLTGCEMAPPRGGEI